MKTHIIKILILSILICGMKAYGQTGYQAAQFKDGENGLRKFLEKKFSEEVKKNKNKVDVCLISVVFAKFTIDTSGNIRSLVFNHLRGTPQVFRNILSSVVLATNGMWLPGKLNGKAVESKPFILPLIYEMESQCNPRDISDKNTYKPVYDGTALNLDFILDFEDNVGSNTNQLDCILLRPLHISSIN